MHLILEDADGHDAIQCHHCHWQGSIADLKKGDYFSLSNITEIFCPHCNKYLGFIQHDAPDKNEGGCKK
ncbi:MAG TPA: hypothetical protein VGI82_07335 [Chitinophagaceae bacterium]